MQDFPMIPGYRIKRELGHGGMATVYLAVQESLDREVAIKVMANALAADRNFSERFLREARTAARLQQVGIVSVYDTGVAGQHHYIAMELVAGGDLKDTLSQGALPAQRAVELIIHIAEALAYAHEKGFVHRDVKPENILFRESGQPVLTDFGIARSIGSSTRMTGAGMSIGTPHYMSPEQARGQEVDGRSDLYSLGVVFYEMLTGQVPFDGQDSFAIGLKHISELPPNLPKRLTRYQPILDRLLAKERNARYQNASELIHSLIKQQPSVSSPVDDHVASTRVIKSILSDQKLLPTNSEPKVSRVIPSSAIWAGSGALLACVLLLGFWFFDQGDSRGVESALGSRWYDHLLEDQGHGVTGEKVAEVGPQDHSSLSERVQPLAASGVTEVLEEREGELLTTLEVALSEANNALERNRLSVPAGDNAIYHFQRVLSLDPDNADARDGLRAVFERYQALHAEAIAASDPNRALELIAALVNSGIDFDWSAASPRFVNGLGVVHLGGYGAPKDPERAIELFLYASDQGSIEAYENLVTGLLFGDSIFDEDTKSIDFLLDAVSRESPTATYITATAYRKGVLFEKDLSAAYNFMQQAVELGHPTATNDLGSMYRLGLFVEPSEERAMNLYKQAYELGYNLSAYNIALHYYWERFGNQNYDEAIAWFRIAAQGGNELAATELGAIYAFGYGVEIDYAEAFKWYDLAATLGDEDAFIMMSYLLVDGISVEFDPERMRLLYEKFANSQDPELKHAYGRLLVTVPAFSSDEKNLQKAYELISISAEQNVDGALYDLGYMYSNGIGTSVDLAKAYQHFRSAADSGDARGTHDIGLMYWTGAYLDYEPRLARQHFISVAHTLHTARFNLSLLYEQGVGGRMSLIESLAWAYLAHAGGNFAADARITNLESMLSSQMIERARRRAEAIQEAW